MSRIVNICVVLIVQLLLQTIKAQVNYSNTNNGRTIGFAEQYGSSIKKENTEPDANGTPFISPDFTTADAILTNGLELKNIKAKFNLETNQVYYADSFQFYVFNTGVLKKISFTQLKTPDGSPLVFQSGYPETGKQNRNYLYQVIEDGEMELLKQSSKEIRTTKNELSGEIWKEYIESGVYYVYVFGLMKELRYDKAFLLEIMTDKKPEIEKYLSANKTNFKKIADIRQLIRFYNGLKN